MKIQRYLVAMGIALLAHYSCSDMNDLHLGYLEEGEIIYAAKVDSVSPGPGNERLMLEIFVKSQRVDFVRAYWNSYQDSLDISIGNKTGVFNVILDNMPESEYLFQLISFDKFGNKSLPFEVVGGSLGESYRKVLPNRRIESIKVNKESLLEISWNYAIENTIYTTFTYTDSSGKNHTIEVKPDEMTTTITDWAPASKAVHNTTYLPSANAIDTFTSNSFESILP